MPHCLPRGLRFRPVQAALALLLAAGAAGCGAGQVTLPGAIPSTGDPAGDLRVRVEGRVTRVPLEQYVVGAALSEVTPVGASADTARRIYEVQAVVARTWAAAHRGRHAAEGFDLCDQTHCQLYQPDRLRTSSFAAIARDAAVRTRGQVLRADRGGPPIVALFHSDCGGHTTTPAAAWGGPPLPYLPAREDRVGGLTHRAWAFDATWAEWDTLLNGDARTAVGQPLTRLEVTATGPGDRVTALRLTGARERTVSGDLFRTVVAAARGPRSVMSTRFTLRPTADGVRLEGSGFGHGVGLCQAGAGARAARGDSLAAILSHYYPGTRLGR